MRADNRIIQEFQKILNSNRLAHAYLFEGGNKKQRHEMALFLAKTQFCENLKDNLPCMECNACNTIDLSDNPDVLEIDTEKRSIGVDEVKIYKESMATRATQGKTKVLVINDAQKMTPQAANNLLKFIEEPDGNVLIVMLANSKNQILPTILSRVQTFKISESDSDSYIEELKKRDFTDRNIQIIIETTELKTVEDMTDEDFTKFLTETKDWFVKSLNGDLSAFIKVQTNIKKMADNRKQQELFWDLVEQLFSDEISLKYDLNREKLLDSDVNTAITTTKLTNQVDLYLDTITKWKSNVSFQACLELLTLNLINREVGV
ncbi:DNA polymerase III subunit delta' [Companilactobacillus sp. RD055328]|uniref:AAA family ATPase n=1 Tax=Companilactobacillus sp. RD055328 TaxID=2916634 RepID=UPI001FC8829E|nr:AAA family ATPase [Companilactobacillus sp. RD055328]GKQ42154.1 DNA polymerase III subunit delta' [Companilactobacillus sp. RD055328]